MKGVFFFSIFLILMFATTVSAARADYSNLGNEGYGTYTLKNTFLGVPTTTIGNYELISNTDICLNRCEAVIKITLQRPAKLVDSIRLNTGVQDVTRGISYEILDHTETFSYDVEDKANICVGYKFVTAYRSSGHTKKSILQCVCAISLIAEIRIVGTSCINCCSKHKN